MDNIADNTIIILQFLLPGFVAAWVFYGLTSYPKPSKFERVIQALIFTLFIQVAVQFIEYILKNYEIWYELLSLILPITIALLFGIIFSYFANNDKIHKILRFITITKETSFPSEWFGAFLNNTTFVVLNLEDDRRLYGWLTEWPSDPTNGHFLIRDPSWIDKDGKEVKITGVNNILIDVKDVKWIEFLEKNIGEIK